MNIHFSGNLLLMVASICHSVTRFVCEHKARRSSPDSSVVHWLKALRHETPNCRIGNKIFYLSNVALSSVCLYLRVWCMDAFRKLLDSIFWVKVRFFFVVLLGTCWLLRRLLRYARLIGLWSVCEVTWGWSHAENVPLSPKTKILVN